MKGICQHRAWVIARRFRDGTNTVGVGWWCRCSIVCAHGRYRWWHKGIYHHKWWLGILMEIIKNNIELWVLDERIHVPHSASNTHWMLWHKSLHATEHMYLCILHLGLTNKLLVRHRKLNNLFLHLFYHCLLSFVYLLLSPYSLPFVVRLVRPSSHTM